MLSPSVESYVALRQSLGYDFYEPAAMLRRFAKFVTEHNATHVSTQHAIDWAVLASSPAERGRRLATVIRFAKHVHAEDDRHEVPPPGVFGHHRQRRLPIILSTHDISRLVAQALQLGPPGSLRPETYSTLLGLIATAGLRISEALQLDRNDYTSDGLVIRETKFHKTRLVPLHPTAQEALQRYLVRRDRAHTSEPNFFVDHKGHKLGYQSVRLVFLGLVKELGLARDNRSKPHLHDLRHAFAVRALLACPLADRETIGQHLLALSTYLGHSCVADTYWYMQATPQLMATMVSAWESYLQGGQP